MRGDETLAVVGGLMMLAGFASPAFGASAFLSLLLVLGGVALAFASQGARS